MTLSPGGTQCAADTTCGTFNLPGSMITLTAAPDPGTRFVSCAGGGCSGSEPTCTLTLNSNEQVTAQFSAVYSVTVTKSGPGSGTVTSDHATIDCGAVCTGQYDAGTTLILTATPAAGSIFAGWTGSCSGTGTCSIAGGDADVGGTFLTDGSGQQSPPPGGTMKPQKLIVTVTGKPKGKSVLLTLRLTGLPAGSGRTTVFVELLKGNRELATATGVVRSGRAQLTLHAKRALVNGRYQVRVRVRRGTATIPASVSLRLR